MKIKTENGNVAACVRSEAIINSDPSNTWLNSNNTVSNTPDKTRSYSQVTNVIYNFKGNLQALDNNTTETNVIEASDISQLSPELVCNKQYQLNSRKLDTGVTVAAADNLEESFEPSLGNIDVYTDITPVDEERVFELSDIDEMTENGIQSLPRGIVNPNYPGFQHLAHTLQDYSSNIENFYHSENEMTDDDLDVEITDLTYETEPDQNGKLDARKILNNNNNIHKGFSTIELLSPQNNLNLQTNLGSIIRNDIPDLIKTISKNNNYYDDTFSYDINCTDADIENNFHAKDIIGDFNKEIEDEIKQLLNYNINIEDDLEELRKDIKDTFAKPIENTINNISDVVNHVIKKLVETKVVAENEELKQNVIEELSVDHETNKINKENEKNARTEMSLNRPTFLLIDSNADGKIADAFLSDGKDEININEYDTDKLSLNVENTIKQLSTELRKIIPKLDEMRERDKLWAECKRESVIIDSNSNEIANTSKGCSLKNTAAQVDFDATVGRNDNHIAGKLFSTNSQRNSKVTRDKQSDITETKYSYNKAQNKVSVRKNDNGKDLELGSFDVYNIETALPKLDLDTIENHLKAAKEAERRLCLGALENSYQNELLRCAGTATPKLDISTALPDVPLPCLTSLLAPPHKPLAYAK